MQVGFPLDDHFKRWELRLIFPTVFPVRTIFHRPSTESLLLAPFPTKIWQSWKSYSFPNRSATFPHQWPALNPSWRYELITDGNIDAYVRSRFEGAIRDVFTSLTDPILKADFLRYLILLREGGVWADIDVLPHQPVSNWIPPQYHGRVNLVVGIENDHHKQPIWAGSPYSVQLCQYTVLAKPGHPAIERVVTETMSGLQELSKSRSPGRVITFEDVMSTTGPFLFTKVLMEYFGNVTGVVHNGDELDRLEHPRLVGDILVLPKDSFGWLPHEHTYERNDPLVLVEHLFIASWRQDHPG